MFESIIQALGAGGVALVILGLFFINFSEKLAESDNKKRMAKGNPAMTDEQISKKIKFFRICGNIMIGLFLIGFIVALIDSFLMA